MFNCHYTKGLTFAPFLLKKFGQTVYNKIYTDYFGADICPFCGNGLRWFKNYGFGLLNNYQI
jgi:hypothetical protein